MSDTPTPPATPPTTAKVLNCFRDELLEGGMPTELADDITRDFARARCQGTLRVNLPELAEGGQ